MKTIGTKKNAGAVGLEWVVLDSKLATAKAVKAQLSDENNAGVKYGLVFKFRGITMLGTVPPGESKPSVPAAAALVALAQQEELERHRKNTTPKKGKKKDVDPVSAAADTLSGATTDSDQVWLVIEKVSENGYWFLMVRDGVPMPTTDVIIPYDAAISLMDEVKSLHPVIFSSDPEIRAQAIGFASRVEDKGFVEITQHLKKGRAQVKPLSGIPASLILSIVLIVCAIGLWWGYSTWKSNQQMKEAQQRAAAAASEQAAKLRQDQAAYDEAVRKAVIDALHAGINKVNATLITPSAPDVIDGWVNLLESTSINHAGWDVSGFDCQYQDELPQCSVALTRGPFGINRLLLEDHPDAVIEGDKASYVVKSSAQQPRQTSIKELPGSSEFTSSFISELQFLKLANISYNLGESKEMEEAVKLPPKPASMFKPGETPDAAAAGGVIKLGVATGELTLSGATLWQLRGLRSLLAGSNLAAQNTNINATRAATGTWNLKVTYAIRLRPEPVLPAVLDSKDQPMTVELPAEFKATSEDLARSSGGNVSASASPTETVDPNAEKSDGQEQQDNQAPLEMLPAPPPAITPPPVDPNQPAGA